MSIKWDNFIKGSAVSVAMLLVFCIGIPACFAGGAFTIIQDERQLAPRGSQIPERRVQQVLKEVKQQKAILKEEQTKGEKQSPASDTTKPESPKKE